VAAGDRHGIARSPTAVRRLRDRRDAGERLGLVLSQRALVDPIVLAIPRGGVVVGYEIARKLSAPLDVLIVRKVGAPGDPEYGLGAVAEGGLVRLDDGRLLAAGFTRADLDPVVRTELAEVADRAARFRGGRPPTPLDGRTAIVVDDGVATGGTVEAALSVVRARGPRAVVLALGVAPPEAMLRLRSLADEVIAALVPRRLAAVGEWYERFDQVEDAEVVRLLTDPHGPSPSGPQ
jgi:putative phosphoribosyl transferase